MKDGKESTETREKNGKFASLRPIHIDNVGTVARDHLASERTWLSYVQTSLAIASIGVAITQLFAIKPIENKNTDDPFDSDLNQVPMESRRNQTRDTVTKYNNPRNFSRPLGTILIVFGILVLLHGMLRYLLIQTALLDGKFPILPRLTLFIFTLLLALFFVTCFVLIIISR